VPIPATTIKLSVQMSSDKWRSIVGWPSAFLGCSFHGGDCAASE
jgi:hypothetical protein